MAITINWMRAKRVFVSVKKETTFRRKAQKKGTRNFFGGDFSVRLKTNDLCIVWKMNLFLRKAKQKVRKAEDFFLLLLCKSKLCIECRIVIGTSNALLLATRAQKELLWFLKFSPFLLLREKKLWCTKFSHSVWKLSKKVSFWRRSLI